MKRESRFATLIRLTDVESIEVGPKYKIAYMKAWYVLDEALNPVGETVLTDGAIRNRYAAWPRAQGKIAEGGQAVTLELPDGERVVTEIASGRRLRWRGWGPMYDAAQVQPGDRLRFVALGEGRYRVCICKPSTKTSG